MHAGHSHLSELWGVDMLEIVHCASPEAAEARSTRRERTGMSHLLAWFDALTAQMSWQEVALDVMAVVGVSLVFVFLGYVGVAIWENNKEIPAGKK